MNHPRTSAPTRLPAGTHLQILILALLIAFPSTGFVQKYAGLPGVAAYVAVVVGLVFLTAVSVRHLAPWLDRHFRVLSAVTIAGLGVGFVVLHPFEDGRGPGKSSDRNEGLEIAVSRMARGETPYYPSNPQAGPLSVLPGSIVLAAPFAALGNSGYQNVFWLAAFLIAASRFFQDKALGLCLLAIPLGISLAAQYEFVSGGDLIANGIFVAVFFLIALESWTRPASSIRLRVLTALLVGLGLASRANFLLLVPLFSAAMWRMSGLRNAIAATSLVVLAMAFITLPFYLHDPAGFTPLLPRQKLAFADQAVPWAGKAMIGVTLLSAIVVAGVLLRKRSGDPLVSFFRGCAIVTLVPMIGAVLFASWLNGRFDFEFMRDRFGLMYVFFALLGWGGILRALPQQTDGTAACQDGRWN
jgi:hypothetical protein